MRDVVIVSAVRSPMGRAIKGQLAGTRIDDVAAEVVVAALKRLPQLDPAVIEDVLVGCAMPEGEQGLNVARHIALLAGIPATAGAATVNRFCGSSLETIMMAAEKIACGHGDVMVTVGIESMSHVPMGGFNPSLNERLMHSDRPQSYISMGITAENLANKYTISREEQDQFSLASHQKALQAMKSGAFTDEIIPVTVVGPDETSHVVNQDEGPRVETSLEKLGGLPPAFKKGGSVTAGNSSPLTDGAAAVVLMAADVAKKMGITPLARLRGMAVAGCAPETMGEGPAFAVPKALARAGLSLNDVDLIELNEAFAAQSLAVVKMLGIDVAKLNVHGGAIALGHPLGCSGARIMATLLHALKRHDKRIGLEMLCIGGGQGIAVVVERLS